ncbi:MAG: hypothetical protein ACHP84_20555 [Caulobacterales bacterium]
MPVIKSLAGVNSLKGIAATASSARLLDLHRLTVEKPDDPEYAERPLFVHPVLNRSIIVKHNVRSGEDDRHAPRRFNATKLIFPFDAIDLGLGGHFLFVGQPDFVPALTRQLNYAELPLDRDVAVLQTLDRLPTLDPFLVNQMLNRQQIEVARCYFRVSEADQAEMLGFVSGEIEALIRVCFDDVQADDTRTRRLAELLLANQDSPELEPLRVGFRLDAAEFGEAMFSWKAFLYYRWRSRKLSVMLKSTLSSIAAIQARNCGRDELRLLDGRKRLLQSAVTSTWREVGGRLRLYDQAFSSLTERETAADFRDFLLSDSSQSIELGDKIGRVEQVVSFWRYRFGAEQIRDMGAEAVLDGLRDLLQALGLTASAAPTPVSAAATA